MKPQTKIRVLRAARHRIATGRNTLICLALQEAGRQREFSEAAALEVIEYVQSLLAPHTTLGQWQRAQGMNTGLRNPKADRLAWIDWMIARLNAELLVTASTAPLFKS